MINSIKLAEGVQLHVLPIEKFKTVHVIVRFSERLSRASLAERALLSNVLTQANASYPTPKDFQTALARNFGMRLGTSVASEGRQHFLTFGMTVVEPRFAGEDTLTAAIDFLRQAIFEPLLAGDRFDEGLVELEKQNGLNYLRSLNDDNAYVAATALDRLFYQDEIFATPSNGTIELLEKVDALRLYNYYQEMLKTNMVDIFVLGNVSEAEIGPLFKTWQFENRQELREVFYSQPLATLSNLAEEKAAFQSQLAMAWAMPIQCGDRDYLALQVFNGLFGGQANSKLFSTVREKESLAYSISSRFDSFTGVLRVMAGVDTENLTRTQELTLSLLAELENGEFTEEDLVQVKVLLRNGYLAGKDSPSILIELAFMPILLPERDFTEETWLAQLEAVQAEDVQRVAKSLTLQAVYQLKGLSESD